MNIYCAIELVDHPEGAFARPCTWCPDDLVALGVLGIGWFGQELGAMTGFVTDVLPAKIEWNGCDQPGIGPRRLAMYQERDLPCARAGLGIDLIAQDPVTADHQADRYEGERGSADQAQRRP